MEKAPTDAKAFSRQKLSAARNFQPNELSGDPIVPLSGPLTKQAGPPAKTKKQRQASPMGLPVSVFCSSVEYLQLP
ncbi:hypothetical protein DSECCO2_171230 [anaerobic digester metagenome]